MAIEQLSVMQFLRNNLKIMARKRRQQKSVTQSIQKDSCRTDVGCALCDYLAGCDTVHCEQLNTH